LACLFVLLSSRVLCVCFSRWIYISGLRNRDRHPTPAPPSKIVKKFHKQESAHNSLHRRLGITRFWRLWIDHYAKWWFVAFKLQICYIFFSLPTFSTGVPASKCCANFSQPQIIFSTLIYTFVYVRIGLSGPHRRSVRYKKLTFRKTINEKYGRVGWREVRIFTHNLCGPHSDNKNRVPEDAKNMHKMVGKGGKARGSEKMQFFLVFEVLLEVL